MEELNTESPGNARKVSDSLLPFTNRYNMPMHDTLTATKLQSSCLYLNQICNNPSGFGFQEK